MGGVSSYMDYIWVRCIMKCKKSIHGDHEWIWNEGSKIFYCICCDELNKKGDLK